jgi:hypothetical protein
LKKAIGNLYDEIDEADVPEDLQSRVQKLLNRTPTLRWDAAIVEIIKKRGRARPPNDARA